MAQQRALADYPREIRITRVAIAITLLAWVATSLDAAGVLSRRWHHGDLSGSVEQILFIAIVQALIWGNFVYQFTRLGYLQRRLAHRPLSREERERIYDQDDQPPSLAILVPSYKEEVAVVQRSLLSAALQDYANRRVVLLIDDPPNPTSAADKVTLEAIRQLPTRLQQSFDAAAEPLEQAHAAFQRRKLFGVHRKFEAKTIAVLSERVAHWIESKADDYPVADHADRFFRGTVLHNAARTYRERADRWRALSEQGDPTEEAIEREYRRLATALRVDFASFERKRYVNLSHQANKAMNLNSYIGLMGRRWRTQTRGGGLHLEPAGAGDACLEFPAADFLITLDADSLLEPEYASLLMHEMRRAGNERLAVVQTPYNTIPGAPGLLERIAGATTDIQYLIHQGFTRFRATYWVGANAMLRMAALHDIRQDVEERCFKVPVFIQDRTVIEDTESSVDLIARGWDLHNYPERLAFSATPPDFGSLLIQRRRWANGGLIILPKLVRHLAVHLNRPRKLVEGFFRAHYLGSITAVNFGLLILLAVGFDQSVDSWWLPVTALPYFVLYARDMRYSGYSKAADVVRIYALNLLLIPVNLGGVLKSVQQVITGRRTPFARTPKISGRTAAPAFYVIAEFVLVLSWLLGCAVDAFAGHWVTALFSLANALMLAYAIHAFIGLRTGWEDIRLGFARPGARGDRVVAPKFEVDLVLPRRSAS
jgi:cellulose synthase/poly-beta-1,6-N-acetylglucosamine synthase-like glycosyltransferase